MRWQTRDGRVGLDLLGEDCERSLGPLVEGEIAECLLEARAVRLAVGELRVVGLECGCDRHGALGRRVGDVGGDRVDLVIRQPPSESGHATASADNLALHALGVGLEGVEAGACRPVRACGAQRVTASATRVGEDGCARVRVGGGLPAARAAGKDKRGGGEGQRQGQARHACRVRSGRSVAP